MNKYDLFTTERNQNINMVCDDIKMDFQAATEANDLLQNGILIETSKGLVCLSLNDALSSNLNLSAEDLTNVATQLIMQESLNKIKNNISTIDVSRVDRLTSSVNSSSVSDSDASSVTTNSNLTDSNCTIPNLDLNGETNKIPIKKRGGWPKGRKRKPELAHMPPKPPATGYNLYLNEKRKEFKDTSLAFYEVTKIIGYKWSNLSAEEKKPYIVKSELEKKRYIEEFKAYKQSKGYQLYLAKKRKKRSRVQYVLSESDMDATDDLDDEDNEELYCRTCDQWFHNFHNKREHMQGKQHNQAVIGDMTRELSSGYDTDCLGSTSSISYSTSFDELSSDGLVSKQKSIENTSSTVSECIANLISVVTKRDREIQSLQKKLQDLIISSDVMQEQLSKLNKKKKSLSIELTHLKEEHGSMECALSKLMELPNCFVNISS